MYEVSYAYAAGQEDGSGKIIAFEAQEVEFPAGDEGYETPEAVVQLQVC